MCRHNILASLLITLFALFNLNSQPITWAEAVEQKEASLDIYWFTSIPFIYQDKDHNHKGVEYDIMQLMIKYAKEKHDVELKINLIEAASFANVLEQVRKSTNANQLGMSAISITDERKKTLQFTNPYLPDVAVLVSSAGSPIVRTLDEINFMMANMTAVTIRGTTYELFLRNLSEQLNANFKINFIDSDNNILEEIKKGENRFGYIDIAIYLMLVKSGGDLTRQNFFTVHGEGYGFAMPKGSDWNAPFNAMFADPVYSKSISDIVAKHISPELVEFFENIDSNEALNTSILTKEKELQMNLIKNANLMLEKEKAYRSVLIFGITASLILFTIIFVLFYLNVKSTRELMAQKTEIESQRESIRQKNEQLQNRNNQLIALNEEKNNLVKILAHDLRSPIGQISVLTDVLTMSNADLSDEDQDVISQIKDGAKRLNDMISKILDFDSLEGNRLNIRNESVDINQLATDVVINSRQNAAQKNIRIVLYKNKTDIAIQTDHLLMTQILENLVSNAIKFSEGGKSIWVKVEATKEQLLISVIDEGPGFTEEDKEKAFNKFQPLSAKPTNGEQSTGLGLSIVKKFTTQLGGRVTLDSTAGNGATITLIFPLQGAV